MQSVETLYGALPQDIYTALSQVRLFVCDIDGVFSDGRIYLGNQGEELKAFHTRDGFGFKALQRIGIKTAVITGRESKIVEQRMRSLNTNFIIQGQENKAQALQDILTSMQLAPEQVAAIGDDVPDLGLFALSAVPIAVADAHPLVLKQARWITSSRGGFGAVREVCDVLLQIHGHLDDITGASV